MHRYFFEETASGLLLGQVVHKLNITLGGKWASQDVKPFGLNGQLVDWENLGRESR